MTSVNDEEFVPEVMTEKEVARAMGAEIEHRSLFSNDELAAVETWDDIINLVADKVDVDFADKVLGDGFSVIPTEDKEELVGVPMLLIDWRFISGDMGDFVSIRAAARMENANSEHALRKIIINDGSTGIMRQLRDFTSKTGKAAGMVVKRGLRISDYEVDQIDPKTGQPTGRKIPARTYYLDTAGV